MHVISTQFSFMNEKELKEQFRQQFTKVLENKELESVANWRQKNSSPKTDEEKYRKHAAEQVEEFVNKTKGIVVSLVSGS